jgi:glutamate racemase
MVAPTSAPIGVFDSGIGGLTVVRELMRQLPAERIIYFGDTARVPYGPKSPETVRRYSREITSYLQGEGVKAVVVACNTATAHALPTLQQEFSLPVLGVVEPGARAAARATTTGRIGVIGTAGTIASGAYERAIRVLAPQAQIIARACPLFVPLVEEGWLDTPATHLIAREYLGPLSSMHVDTLVLGCTHYPLLKPLLAKELGPSVRLIDSAEQTAAATASVLAERELCAPSSGAPVAHRFISSDVPEQFLRLAQRFLGTPIEGVEKVTLG